MADDYNKEQKIKEIVAREVFVNQSMLIDYLLGESIFNYEDIDDYWKDEYWCEKCGIETPHEKGYCDVCDEYTDEDEPKEIFEWWAVSDWLLEKLAKKSEPILRTDYGDWWGRTTTGQAIYMDGVIEEVYDEIV